MQMLQMSLSIPGISSSCSSALFFLTGVFPRFDTPDLPLSIGSFTLFGVEKPDTAETLFVFTGVLD
jgi:hypothetical protein